MPLKILMETSIQTLNMKAESASPPAAYTTNMLLAAWGAMTFNEVLMLIGTILGVATFAVNFYFQKKRSQRERAKELREQEFHKARMIKEESNPDG